MAAEFTRRDLKTDRFAVEVEHTVDYVSLHRSQAVKIGVAVVLVLAAVGGFLFWRAQRTELRQARLGEAFTVQEAPVGAASPTGVSFPTPEAKDAAVAKAFSSVAAEFPGSQEASIAQYYLASAQLRTGKMADGRKTLESLVEKGNKEYASLAKLSLAQLDYAENRAADGEKLLRDLMANPTDLVSKEEATIVLARHLARTNPAQARVLLQGLMVAGGTFGQEANAAMAEINGK